MFVTKKIPRSLSAEAYRSLRTSIKFSSIDKPIKTIVVTSSLVGEGKSTVVGNLAYSLSQDGARVLVIDCDLRKPSIHENFLLSNENNITAPTASASQIIGDIICDLYLAVFSPSIIGITESTFVDQIALSSITFITWSLIALVT